MSPQEEKLFTQMMFQYTQNVDARIDSQLGEFRKETNQRFSDLETRMDTQFQSLRDILQPLGETVKTTESVSKDLKSAIFTPETGLRDRVQNLEAHRDGCNVQGKISETQKKIDALEKDKIADDASRKTLNKTVVVLWTIFLAFIAALGVWAEFFHN